MTESVTYDIAIKISLNNELFLQNLFVHNIPRYRVGCRPAHCLLEL
jgi:hypothetical protein